MTYLQVATKYREKYNGPYCHRNEIKTEDATGYPFQRLSPDRQKAANAVAAAAAELVGL